MRSIHISQVIAAAPQAVYDFVADPDNLPSWAAGLARSEVTRDGDALVVASPMGEVRVTFVSHNDLGILDHRVQLPSGEVVDNPVRVIDHPEGAEIIFTIRQLGLSDEEFTRDAAAVRADLDTLKSILEGSS